MNFTKIKDYLNEKFSEISNKNFMKILTLIKSKIKKALLYYKCTPKFINSKIGTTEYQSLSIAKAINKAGYIVTVVDRKLIFDVEKKYSLFVGAFNTGGFATLIIS